MAIPFRDLTDEEFQGTAGYLKFIRLAEKNYWLGTLFLIDSRGEPVEFTYASVREPSSFLWRPEDLRIYCLRTVCCAIFDACPSVPLFILCLAEEVGPFLFSEYIQLDLPVGRLCPNDTVDLISPAEVLENVPIDSESTKVSLYWTNAPTAESPVRRLFDTLSMRNLLLEPFERAEAGLREVYKDLLG